MTELKINKTMAKKIYKDAPEWFKNVLTDSFGEDTFKEKSFEDIKTFEDACEELGFNPEKLFSETDESDEIAYKKLKIIARAINSGWTPDWNNVNQCKYFPYFQLSSGFGFSVSLYFCVSSITDVGSRLCFESREKAIYAGKQFTDLYKEYLIISK